MRNISRRRALLAFALPLSALAVLSTLRVTAADPPEAPKTSPAPPVATGDDTPATAPAASTLNPTLREANTAIMAGRTDDAAHLLDSVDTKTLDERNTKLWRLIWQYVAIRRGDTALLKKLNAGQGPSVQVETLTVTTAAWALRGGDFDRTQALLQQVRAPDALTEIPRREYLALWARLGQLRQDPKLEATYITKLVNFASNWPEANCQTCHANPKKYGDAVTTLDLSGWWAGERYSALLKQSGQAATVQVVAEKALAADPHDEAARLRLAYALRAEGKNAEAEKALRALPWAQFPDREQRDPLRLRVFP